MIRALLVSAALIGIAAAPAASKPQQASPSATQAADERDPDAMAALSRMGAAMRKLNDFNLHADITTEDVLDDGQKLQFGGTVDIITRRPDRFRVMLKVGQSERQIYYDGKNVTVFAPGPMFYAVFAAPPTIRQTVQVAADEHGIEIPLADMFFWGEDRELEARVLSAFPVGKEAVGGHMCEHYAVRQALVDWQIWIREGEEALPCKLVITSTYDPAMPQYTALYNWLSAAPVIDDGFAFKPPESAHQIQFDAGKTPVASTGK